MIRWCGLAEAHEGHEDCPGTPGEAVMPTDEQFLGRLRELPDEEALEVVAGLRSNTERAMQCFTARHDATSADAAAIRAKVAAVSDWIDGSYPPGLDAEVHLRRRTDKVAEEAGEVIAAVNGYVGENPRKGVTNGPAQVEDELLDSATAALGALYHLTGGCDVVQRLADHVDRVWRRAGLAPEETPR